MRTFRFVTPADAAAISAIYGPHCSSGYASFETVAPSVDEMRTRIETVSNKCPWLVAEIDGGVAGYAYASPHRARAAYRWSVDVTVYVDPLYHRQGIGLDLYRKLLPILGALGYFRAYAGIALPNEGSLGLHEAVGFKMVGVYRGVGYKFGEWRDVAWLQLDLNVENGEPPEPLSISDLYAPGQTP